MLERLRDAASGRRVRVLCGDISAGERDAAVVRVVRAGDVIGTMRVPRLSMRGREAVLVGTAGGS